VANNKDGIAVRQFDPIGEVEELVLILSISEIVKMLTQ
jgi:hypothetical protein